jgi:hypothetical protein
VSTSGREYDNFTRLFFLYEYLEVSILTGELPEESVSRRQLDNLKGPVGLILPKVSEMRVTIPIDLSI